MAKKAGFQYYKVETDRYDDVRIRKLKMTFGAKGISVYDYLLAQIYRYKGCFIVRDEDCVFNVAEYFGVKEQVVTEIIVYCGEVGLFDKELLTGGNVITSAAIQRRYAEMCKLSKRIYVEIPRNILLIEEYIVTEKLLLYEDWLKENSGKNEKTPEDSRKNEKTPEETAFPLENSRKIEKTPEESDISKVEYSNSIYIQGKEEEEKRLTSVSRKENETECEVVFDSPAGSSAQTTLLPSLSTEEKETTAQKMAKQQALLEKRQKKFIESLAPFLPMYGRDMLNEFYSYWTEPNKSRTKMKFEIEKTWDLSRRLATWSKRDYNYNKRSNGRKEQSSPVDSMQDAVRAGISLSDAERQFDEEFK